MHPLFDERRYLIPFRGSLLPQIFCDTLVIGTGIAGLTAALSAAEHGEVILLRKSPLQRSSSAWAQGGIAAVTSDQPDDIESHVQDTLAAGGDLCDPRIVREVVAASGQAIDDLQRWGMEFDRNESGDIDLGREGGHRKPRILHADGDATGRMIVQCLGRQVSAHPSIRIFDDCFALDLLTPTNDGCEGPVLGAITSHPKHGLQMIWAWATVLATGGCSQVYRESTNPPASTGDGIAMAYRAGAKIADMAFVQFHPTTLYVAGAERSLITEAVRGEGGHLVDRRGQRFMTEQHEMAELAPRDVVSRAILSHLGRTGDTHVFLDCRHFESGYFARRFPGIAEQLSRFAINPQTDLIPVHPSAHYTIGGVWTDDQGRTNLPGLYACGEVTCTGLHGANRLASNSLLEGLVFGKRAGQTCFEARENGANGHRPPRKIISDIPLSPRGELDLNDVRSSLRSVIWRHLGIVREESLMADVRQMIDFWAQYTLDKIFDEPAGWETQNLLLIASMICESARWRTESRGTHARDDFPKPDDALRCHDVRQRFNSECMRLPAERAPITEIKERV